MQPHKACYHGDGKQVPFSAGSAKGANLVVTFMDWLVALDPDGRPTNTFRHVGLTVPAQQNTKDETVAMVVTGLSAPPGYAPGPYGNFGAAKSRTMRTLRTDDDGFSTAEESWKFEGENGDLVALELQFARRAVTTTKLEAKVYSAGSRSSIDSTGSKQPWMWYAAPTGALTGSKNISSKGRVLDFAHFLTDRGGWSASHLFLGFRERPFFRPRRSEP